MGGGNNGSSGLEWRLKQRVRDKWLLDVFGPLSLRRTKDAVVTQLGLRPASVIVKLLTFSNFEVRPLHASVLQRSRPAAYFASNHLIVIVALSKMALYQEKLKPILKEVQALRSDADDGGDADKMASAKSKLEVLRKGCCHPQVLYVFKTDCVPHLHMYWQCLDLPAFMDVTLLH